MHLSSSRPHVVELWFMCKLSCFIPHSMPMTFAAVLQAAGGHCSGPVLPQQVCTEHSHPGQLRSATSTDCSSPQAAPVAPLDHASHALSALHPMTGKLVFERIRQKSAFLAGVGGPQPLPGASSGGACRVLWCVVTLELGSQLWWCC